MTAGPHRAARAGILIAPALPRVAMIGLVLAAPACASEGLDPVRADAVVVTPASVELVPGETVQLQALVLDAAGVAFLGPPVLWNSREARVASVSRTGVVTAGNAGVTVVEAEADGVVGTAEVTVIALPEIGLSPASLVFTGVAGGADPDAQMVAVSNTGDGTLEDLSTGTVTFGAGAPTGWLTIGIVESPLTLIVRVTIDGLATGSYSAAVPVQGRNASTVNLPVSLSVSP